MTLTDLTSEVEWDRVLYYWYGRALLMTDELRTLSQGLLKLSLFPITLPTDTAYCLLNTAY